MSNSASDTPDAEYPHLSQHRAKQMLDFARTAVHSHGGVALPAGERQWKAIFDDRDPVFVGFDNLALNIADLTSEDEIRETVHNFIATVVTPSERLTDEEFYKQLKLRLLPAQLREQAPAPVTSVLEEFCPGLDCYLVVDGENAVRGVSADEAASHDSVGALWNIGRQNLRHELDNLPVDIEPVQFEDSAAAPTWIATSPSFFLTTAPVFGDEYLRKWFPNMDQSNGVLLGLPHRHLMLGREVTTGLDLLHAIQALTQLTITQYESQPGPVSLHLYLYYGGELTPISFLNTNEEGQTNIAIAPTDHLVELLNHEE